MRYKLLIILTISTFSLSQASRAEEVRAVKPDDQIAPAAKRVHVVEDQQAGAFLFMIDGQEAARIDKDGLTVAGDVEYSGTLTDTGAGITSDARNGAP